jgi:hypothetical protein
MVILRIEHRVSNYGGWKQAFDSDPVDRKGSGVRRYQILRGWMTQMRSGLISRSTPKARRRRC